MSLKATASRSPLPSASERIRTQAGRPISMQKTLEPCLAQGQSSSHIIVWIRSRSCSHCSLCSLTALMFPCGAAAPAGQPMHLAPFFLASTTIRYGGSYYDRDNERMIRMSIGFMQQHPDFLLVLVVESIPAASLRLDQPLSWRLWLP